MKKILKDKFVNYLTKVDQFGHPVTLKYKNDTTYKSMFGGVVTILVFTGLLAYFLVLLNDIAHQQVYTVKNSLEKSNMAFDSKSIYLNKDNFDIAVFLFFNGNATIQEDMDLYFQYNIQTAKFAYAVGAEQAAEWGNSYQLNTTNHTLELCKPYRFGGAELGAEVFGITNQYFCPKDDFQFTLSGSFSSMTAEIIQLYVHYCTQDYLDKKFPGMNKKCKSKEQADSIINQVQVYIPLMTSYFDSSSFDGKPIKNSINFDLYSSLHPILSNNRIYKISENKVQVQDQWITDLGGDEEKTYIDLRFAHSYLGQVDLTQNMPLLTMQFVLDENAFTLDRTVTTLSDIFSQLGGLFTIVIVVVNVCISWYQECMYYSDVLGAIFYVHKKGDGKKTMKKKSSSQSIIGDIEQQSHQRKESQRDLVNVKNKGSPPSPPLPLHKANTMSLQRSLGFNHTIAQVTQLYDYIHRLQAFAYSFTDYLGGKFREYIKLFNKKQKIRKRDKLYNQGIDKMETQLDIIKVFKSLRSVELLSQIVLAKYQQKLLPYLRSNILQVEEEDAEQVLPSNLDPDDSDYTPLNDSDQIYQNIKQLISVSRTSKKDSRILKNLVNKKYQKEDKDDPPSTDLGGVRLLLKKPYSEMIVRPMTRSISPPNKNGRKKSHLKVSDKKHSQTFQVDIVRNGI